MDFESICSHILRTYEENKPKADFNTSNFMDFDIMKKSLVMRLVNMKQNESLLQKVPYLKFLDLAVVFQYVVTEIGDEYATILVHNVHMKLWNVTVDDLYKIAMENTPKLLPYNLMNIESIFREQINMESTFCEGMFMLTNRLRIYGATSVLYPELLEVIKEKVGDDKWIMIPSSVHEWLILPEKDFGYMKNKEDLQMFITSVNKAELKEEEILSNHAYHFNWKELAILE